jgi:hypothetical protein
VKLYLATVDIVPYYHLAASDRVLPRKTATPTLADIDHAIDASVEQDDGLEYKSDPALRVLTASDSPRMRERGMASVASATAGRRAYGGLVHTPEPWSIQPVGHGARDG